MSEEFTVNVGMELKKRGGEALRYDGEITDVGLCSECSAKVAGMKESGEPMTIKSVVVNLLDSVSTSKNGSALEGLEKRRRGQLADKIYAAEGLIDLSLEDRTVIKELVGSNCAPLVVNQIFPIIDPSLKDE